MLLLPSLSSAGGASGGLVFSLSFVKKSLVQKKKAPSGLSAFPARKLGGGYSDRYVKFLEKMMRNFTWASRVVSALLESSFKSTRTFLKVLQTCISIL